jgi:exodeoxyribonuclease V gamma subunit
VRRRFRFDDDDLTRIQDWVAETGIRWGLDAAHRKPFKLDRLPFGTWRAGLDRLMLGVTMTEDELRLFNGVLPLDDVESGAIDLAGRAAEFIARLEHIIGELNTPKPIASWAETLASAADALTSTSTRDSWHRAELQRLLGSVVGEASIEDVPNDTVIALPEVRALLGERLRGRPTRANFRTGHLTICTLVPMRSVPHRIVCLLGLDDGAFPRKAPRDGDDLTLDDPHVGERDPRTEDRQMLLDALLAATDRLIITYTGNDERTNSRRPPAVPVGELLDIVDATVRTDEGRASQRVEIRHPLQPFDPRNFTHGALVPERTWSFDSVTLGGARALTGTREEPKPFLEGVLPAPATSLVEIEDLVRFVQHPVKAFLRQRLGINLGSYWDEIEDGLRIELDGLGRWGVGQRLLDARLAGIDGRAATLAEIARGMLPPGKLGEPVVQDVYPVVTSLMTEVQALAVAPAAPASIDVRVGLSDGLVLSGTVPGVSGDLLLTTTYSRLAPKHRLTAWVRLLALTAADPERAFTAATVGRGGGSASAKVARIQPLADDADGRHVAALGHLATLVDLYERGMREPLPLYCATSAAYAEAARRGEDAAAAGTEAWKSPWSFDKEDREPEHLLVLGAERTFDELLDEAPRPDETGPGWEAAETTRLGRLARRLWDGLLASEETAQT